MIAFAISASSTTIEQRQRRLAIRTCSGLSEPVPRAVFAISLLLRAHHVLEILRSPTLDEAVHPLGCPMAWASLCARDSRA